MSSKFLYIILLLLIISFAYIKLNYVYFKGDYYVNGLIYSSRDSTLLNGIIIDFEKDSYSTILKIKNGLLIGKYEHDFEVSGNTNELYLSDDIDLEHLSKILQSKNINISIDTETYTSLQVVLVVQDTGFYNRSLSNGKIFKQAHLIHEYLNYKYKLKNITFYFKDHILNNTKVKYIYYSF